MKIVTYGLNFSHLLFKRTITHSSYVLSSSSSDSLASVTPRKDSIFSSRGSLALAQDTLGNVVDRAATDFANNEALIFVHQDIRKTWQDVKYEADRLASGFISLGLNKGDRIGIWATNLYEWQLTQYAAAKAGLILVNVNQAYQVNELEYCLKKAGIRTLIAASGFKTSDFYAMLVKLVPALADGEPCVPINAQSERLPDLHDIVIITKERKRGVLRFDDLLDAGKGLSHRELVQRQAQVDCHDPCGIQFTSGTTGLPKGAVLSHHGVINNMRLMAARLGYDNGRARICISVPLYHAFGCVVGSVLAPLHGNTLVFPSETFDGEASLQATQDESCTHMYGTPTMFVDMVSIARQQRHDISSLSSGIVAGAVVPFHLMQAMVTDMNMRDAVVMYGMTEGCVVTTGFPSDDMEHRCGTVGCPLDHTEVKVIDKQGETVPIGLPGELCVRGYNVFQGYWDDAAKTSECLTQAGWFLTGDLAVMSEDGFVKIVGRSKDVVIRGGENIYPAEVEDFLMTHPDVLEVHAFGVPDDRMGEELAVWIRTRKPGSNLGPDIRSFCVGKIAHYKIPRYIQFRDDFPKTVTGKVQKFIMRNIMSRELGLTQ